MKRLSLSEVLLKLKIAYDDKYDYSLFDKYENKNQKVDLICKIHGVFNQNIGNHLYHKAGCPKCGLKVRKKLYNPVLKFKEVHGDKYDYSKVDYKSIKSKVEIICIKHGSFYQTPNTHLKGSGCPKCGLINMSGKLKKPLVDFINKCKDVHDNIYDYDEVCYENLSDKIKIICKEHGVFYQRAFSHQQGYGCSRCNKSKGEKKIEYFLNKNKIYFEYNKHFETCRNKNTLPFDFFIPKMNICIEFDGIQHYESIEYFGGDDKLKYQNRLDCIKNKWCLENNILLVRISYKDFQKIENILSSILYK
jgi:hypothetical protein